MNKLCFIVVNYFGSIETYKMYCSLIRSDSDFELFDFIIVDNSANIDEFSNLRSVFEGVSNVEIIRSSKNIGYFPGLNLGLSKIDGLKYSHVVISNNDLSFESGFISTLMSKFDKYEDPIYAICPDVVTLDGVHQNPHVEKRYNFLQKLKLDLYYCSFSISRILFSLKRLLPARESSLKCNVGKEIHLGIGAIYILTQSFFKFNSTLDYSFFLYGEEAFFSNQIHSSGGILFYDPDLVVHHNFSATTSKIPDKIRYSWAKESYAEHRKYL